jgi:hypothetical protein
MQKGTTTLEDSYKIKPTLYHTIQQLCFMVFIQKKWKLMFMQNPAQEFIYVALFIIANIWEQPRCLSVGKYINSRQWNIIQF